MKTIVRLSAAGEEHHGKMTAEHRCLSCEKKFTPDTTIVRGVCLPCYSAIRRAVKAGKVAEKSLIRDGKLGNASKGGRPASNPFTKSLVS